MGGPGPLAPAPTRRNLHFIDTRSRHGGRKSPAFGRAWPIERIRPSLHDTSPSPRTDRPGLFRLFSRRVVSPILPTRHSRNQTPVGERILIALSTI